MKKIAFALALLLALFTVSCGNVNSSAIHASGQIETQEIEVAPELSGRVVEVSVKEGDTVKQGDPLLRLDDSLLQSEKQAAQAVLNSAKVSVRTAQASLDSAQAQYNLVLSTALAVESREDVWRESKPSEFDQPIWYFSKQERIQSAQVEIDSAQADLDKAQSQLAETEQKVGSATFLEIEKKVSDKRVAFDVAKTVLDHTSDASDGSDLHDAAQTAFDEARIDLENAQKDYDDALTTDGAKDVLEVRAKVLVARERYHTALDSMRNLQTGEDSLSVVAAGKAEEQARTMLEQAQSNINSAQANIDLLNAQMDKLTIRAPMDGVVLVRSIETGEVIQAGMPAMTIGKLDTLKVTVYIPEDQYGQINLGQQATLSVDSFPNESFHATVTQIANQAEFTPQNVQTKEGRQTTVYAIELTLDNKDGKLKPGMPTDVTFVSDVTEK